jgi:class 3 adenylate cyclase
MRYLNKVLENQPGRLVKLHLETKIFKPSTEHREKRFEWPWQRSIEHNLVQLESGQYHSLKYKPVPTVSLVADLRKSTRALEQLPSEYVGEFSTFLTEIVDIARERVFEFGGFFDKETGDGIVGHFVDFTMLGEVDSARKRAFHAAEKMIQEVNLRCVALQKKLHLGVEGLGVSVGVHQQEAVWVTEADQVRAIGPSVVLAARLCGDADRSSVFVSNSLFETLHHELPSSTLSKFSKKEYAGKEHDPHVGLYGYQIGIGEAFER